jgi:hypothetical protein
MGRTGWLVVDIGLKVLLVGLLLLALLFPDLPQFAGKAMGGRILTYGLATLLVPAIWMIGFRRHPYPFAIDILFVLPFAIDVAGNALDLYDTIDWWDDANHLVNWALLTGAAAIALARLPLGRLNRFALGVGFGAVTAIAWELAEYLTFIRDSPELATAYTDTLGDLLLGTTGATLASAAVAWLTLSPGGASASPGGPAHGDSGGGD